jgi:(p)ppGpp synthase/HD superfamily hydrolase
MIKTDNSLINKSKRFAKNTHKNQKRKDGRTPYINHLRMVVDLIKKSGVTDNNVQIIGWLHDTIEDTPTDFDEIRDGFGLHVAKCVSALTKDMRIEKQKREMLYVRELKKSHWHVKLVKICDITANILDLENTSYSKNEKINHWKCKKSYLIAIKNGLIKNKKKIPHIKIIFDNLNCGLAKFGQSQVSI